MKLLQIMKLSIVFTVGHFLIILHDPADDYGYKLALLVLVFISIAAYYYIENRTPPT